VLGGQPADQRGDKGGGTAAQAHCWRALGLDGCRGGGLDPPRALLHGRSASTSAPMTRAFDDLVAGALFRLSSTATICSRRPSASERHDARIAVRTFDVSRLRVNPRAQHALARADRTANTKPGEFLKHHSRLETLTFAVADALAARSAGRADPTRFRGWRSRSSGACGRGRSVVPIRSASARIGADTELPVPCASAAPE
jgi:hypothetical protein